MLAFGLSVLSLSRLRGAVFARGCRTSSCDKSEGLVKTTRSRTTMIRGFPNEFNNSPNADGHDRLIGELVDFPCVFIFKVVGTNEGEFMDDIVDTVSECVNIDSDKLKVSFRDRGRYRSITLNVPCNTADQVYNIYAAIDRDPRVKFKF